MRKAQHRSCQILEARAEEGSLLLQVRTSDLEDMTRQCHKYQHNLEITALELKRCKSELHQEFAKTLQKKATQGYLRHSAHDVVTDIVHITHHPKQYTQM